MTEPVAVNDSVQSTPVQPQNDLSQNVGTDTIPGKTTTSPTSGIVRKYLTLEPLKKLDLPHHPSYDNANSDHRVSLAQFLESVFKEVQGIDFDEGFEKRGTWSPETGHVMMPPLNATGSSDMVPVPISVEKRIKDVNQASWMVRTSTHSDSHVKFFELGDLLARDHSRNEAAYTPSVFDAVELLRWDPEEALRAAHHQEEIHSVEMFISQMFHMMPKVAGLSLLQDRVFHALIITMNTYKTESLSELALSLTVQLPIDYASFEDVKVMQERSRMKTKGSSKIYQFPSSAGSGSTPDANQKQRQGKKLTEGTYVSLERLISTSAVPIDGDVAQQAESSDSNRHRWDMMTLSTAGGMTKKAPKGIQQKETLEAIAMDVEYVLSYIADQRRKSRT